MKTTNATKLSSIAVVVMRRDNFLTLQHDACRFVNRLNHFSVDFQENKLNVPAAKC